MIDSKENKGCRKKICILSENGQYTLKVDIFVSAPFS